MKWLLLAIAVPLVELISITLVAQRIGGAATLALLLLAMGLGLLVIRAGVRRLRVAAGGRGAPAPTRSSATDPTTWTEPLVMIAAGVLLVVPGFVGDVVGLALLVPGVRLGLLALIGARLARRFPSASSTLTTLRITGGGPVVPGDTNDPPQPKG